MNKQNLSILTITMGSGGAQKVISLLLKELIKDFNVSLVLFYNQVHFDIPKEVDLVVFSTEPSEERGVFQKFSDFVKFCRNYRKLLRTRNIHYSIAFLAFPNIVSGIVSLFNKNCKMVISERGFPSDNITSKLSLYISKTAYPLFYNKCDSLFSNSTHINHDLKKNFGVDIPMEVIYNPIEPPTVFRTPKTYLASNKDYKIITAGSVITRKNQEMILRALKRINSKVFTFSVLGDGHLKGALQQKAKSLGIDSQVVFHGTVKNVGAYLPQYDCFVLSSFTEGFPNALLEGMSYGLPCISTNCLSGPLEMLNENKPVTIGEGEFVEAKYGILINNDDDKALSAALVFLQQRPDKQAYYSKMSRQRAMDYDLKTVYNQFKTFIQS
ncbi:hypothetical protein FGF1_36080 [Flavobacteriaceae bacterium GF1]